MTFLHERATYLRLFNKGRGGLVDRAADSGPCDPNSIPLGEKRKINEKEAGAGPYKKTVQLHYQAKIRRKII